VAAADILYVYSFQLNEVCECRAVPASGVSGVPASRVMLADVKVSHSTWQAKSGGPTESITQMLAMFWQLAPMSFSQCQLDKGHIPSVLPLDLSGSNRQDGFGMSVCEEGQIQPFGWYW
jgi:hypothetical protein